MNTMVSEHEGKPVPIHGRALTDELVEAVWLDPGLTRRTAAALLGTTVSRLTKHARGLDLPMREQADKRSDIVPVTDEQVRAIWARDDLSRAKQAAVVGITVATLRGRATKLQLPMRRGYCDKRISAAQIREAWLDPRLTGQQAADKVGLTRTNLWLRAKALNLPPRKRGRRFAIASAEDRTLFEEMWEGHVVVADIAEHFELHKMTVSACARRFGLSKRTRPSLLIPMATFWRRRRKAYSEAATKAAPPAHVIAQFRYEHRDFHAPAEALHDLAVRTRVRDALRERGTSITEVARRIGVPHQHVSSVARGLVRSAPIEAVLRDILGRPLKDVRALERTPPS